MPEYNETVLYSSMSGTNAAFTLSGEPTAYDFLRVSYGSPAIPRTSGETSFPNLGAMNTIDLPTNRNFLVAYSNFIGSVTTASGNNMYRAAALCSGCSSTAWTRVFNSYGHMSADSAATTNRWNHIYTVVGVNTGSAGSFYKDLLYDYDRDGSAIILNRHPSAYRRIGISFGFAHKYNSAINHGICTYAEYPYSFLSTYNKGHIITQHPFYSADISASQRRESVNLYSGCSGTAWSPLWSVVFNQSAAGSFGVALDQHVITRVVGIDRK